MGIDPLLFAEYLVGSGNSHPLTSLTLLKGLVLNEEVTWVCFHGGFDFGYLVKLITCAALPKDENQFMKIFNTYFPNYFDVKYMISDYEKLKFSGLTKLGNDLNVLR